MQHFFVPVSFSEASLLFVVYVCAAAAVFSDYLKAIFIWFFLLPNHSCLAGYEQGFGYRPVTGFSEHPR
jgi:hypothetical protein